MAIYLGTNKIDLAGLQPGNQLGYMGNAKLIAEKTFSFPLSDTNYSSLTISTSSQTLTLPATDYSSSASTITALKVGENYDGTPINKTLYDYVCIGEGIIEYKYTASDSTINALIHGVKCGMCRDYQYGKYHTINSAGALNTAFSNGGSYVTGQAVLLYRKTDGTYAATTNTAGIYTTSSPACSMGTTSGKDYLNLTLSTIYAKASASYFPVEAMNYIDPTQTILTFTWHIYEGDTNVYSRIYQTAYDNATL